MVLLSRAELRELKRISHTKGGKKADHGTSAKARRQINKPKTNKRLSGRKSQSSKAELKIPNGVSKKTLTDWTVTIPAPLPSGEVANMDEMDEKKELQPQENLKEELDRLRKEVAKLREKSDEVDEHKKKNRHLLMKNCVLTLEIQRLNSSHAQTVAQLAAMKIRLGELLDEKDIMFDLNFNCG